MTTYYDVLYDLRNLLAKAVKANAINLELGREVLVAQNDSIEALKLSERELKQMLEQVKSPAAPELKGLSLTTRWVVGRYEENELMIAVKKA